MTRPDQFGTERLRAIRIALIQRGLTMESIGRMLNPPVSRCSIHCAITGKHCSSRIEALLRKLFPEIIRRFPFPKHGSRVAQTNKVVSCPDGQEGKPPKGARSPRTKRSAA